MNIHKIVSASLLSLVVLGVTACGPKSGPEASNAGTQSDPEAASPTSFLLADAPQTAPSLTEALEAHSAGETLLVSGRVGGLVNPISDDFAGFVLADESLVFCDEMENKGHCPTPWDACCEDPDKILASRAFVQFEDGTGMPLPVNLRDAVGLAENDTVVVKGILSSESTPENRIIIAEGLSIVR